MLDNYNLKETLIIGYFDKNGCSCRAVRAAKLSFEEVLFPKACYDDIENIPKVKNVKAFELGNSDKVSILSINVEIQNKWAHIFVSHLYNMINSSDVKRVVLLSSIYPIDIPKDLTGSSFFETSFDKEYLTEFGINVNLQVSGIFLNYLFQIAILKHLPLNIFWVIGNKCKQGVPSIRDLSLQNIETLHAILRGSLNQEFDVDVSKSLEIEWEEDNLMYQ